MRRFLLVMSVMMPILAVACYNDRDTLGYELHNKPDVQRALTGRFDRFPPLYFQMRIDRIRRQPTRSQSDYDDLAVALGRLGRNDEALAALAEKAKLPNPTIDERYRLFANRGTIEAHRWIQEGGNVSKIGELKHAAADIAEAIRLNPNAHFGREGVQLEVIRWLIDLKTGKRKDSLGDWLAEKMMPKEAVNEGTAKSLAGLIMLGGAWESPDIAAALVSCLEWRNQDATGALALLRYNELIRSGKKPINQTLADSDATDNGFVTYQAEDKTLVGRFKMLRKEAEEWHDAKTNFMMAKLRVGSHPDTDPNFWSGWTEPAMPVLPTRLPTSWMSNQWVIVGELLAILAAVTAGLLFVVNRFRRAVGFDLKTRR